VLALIGVIVPVLIFWRPWSSAAAARVSLLPLAHNAVVPAGIDSLRTPPAFPSGSADDHCAVWRDWFGEHGAAELSVPTIEISAPADAYVTVTSASVHVFRSYQPASLTSIMCLHGAGPSAGTLLNFDLDRPNATPTVVADDGSDHPLSFPTAVITIPRGQTQYVAVTPRGSALMYEWSVDLHLVVDQREQAVSFGSRDHLRSWLGPVPSQYFDYSPQTHSWEPVAP
jgi:hypothetical protein